MNKNRFSSIIIALVILLAFSGCAEPRYNHDGDHHRNERHRNHRRGHDRAAVGVDLNIHN
ncbi:MAG: hypothetical protein Q8891_09085 [Bacteroidota bacterium]|nr:hypothetical protein [Bacteroidota bacterium]